MNIPNFDEINLGEQIIKLTPETYEKTLKTAKETYLRNKDAICEAISDTLLHLPGLFIQLIFILDLSEEEPLFCEDMRQIIDDAFKTQEPSFLLNLLLNLYFLESYLYLKKNEMNKLLLLNGLNLLDKFDELYISKKYITKTRKLTEKNYNIILPDIIFSENMKKELINLVDIHSETHIDTLIALQIMKMFSFSHLDCRSYLLNHFFSNEYESIIIAMFLYNNLYPDNKVFIICLFIGFSRVECFLSTFYKLLPDILSMKDSNELVYMLTQLIYEKYYYPNNERRSAYVKNAGYDALTNDIDKRMFKDTLNTEMINKLQETSNKNMLRQVLNPEHLALIIWEKIIDCDVIDLQTILKNKTYDEITKFSRDDFFKSFLSVSQQSISHFLTYMEILKDQFIMNEEEQKIFYTLLVDLYSQKTVFLRVVVQKMLKFGILHESIVTNSKNLI